MSDDECKILQEDLAKSLVTLEARGSRAAPGEPPQDAHAPLRGLRAGNHREFSTESHRGRAGDPHVGTGWDGSLSL